jgi:hypothetical protein
LLTSSCATDDIEIDRMCHCGFHSGIKQRERACVWVWTDGSGMAMQRDDAHHRKWLSEPLVFCTDLIASLEEKKKHML